MGFEISARNFEIFSIFSFKMNELVLLNHFVTLLLNFENDELKTK